MLRRVRSRLVVSVLAMMGVLAPRLPEPLLSAAIEAAAGAMYRAQPARRALVRANLDRVCRFLKADGRASSDVAIAAADPEALDRLVRRAFAQYVRYYVEVLVAPSYGPQQIAQLVRVETPDAVAELLSPAAREQGTILVALHLGAIELPGRYLAEVAGRPVTAPMETLADPILQRFIVRRRGRTGVRIVPLRDARRALLDVLDRGEIAGLIADRALGVGGYEANLFGARAVLPAGPALLATERDVPVWVAAVHRLGSRDRSSRARYGVRLLRLETPAAGTRRERVSAFLAVQARLFEDLIAVAPEQWWTIFFPIWPDLQPGSAPAEVAAGAAT